MKAAVFDVDGFTTTKEQVAELKQAGRRTICYLSTGAWEDFRPDADAFPPELRGRATAGRASAGWTSGGSRSWSP